MIHKGKVKPYLFLHSGQKKVMFELHSGTKKGSYMFEFRSGRNRAMFNDFTRSDHCTVLIIIIIHFSWQLHACADRFNLTKTW